jgi:hypothetical protein
VDGVAAGHGGQGVLEAYQEEGSCSSVSFAQPVGRSGLSTSEKREVEEGGRLKPARGSEEAAVEKG